MGCKTIHDARRVSKPPETNGVPKWQQAIPVPTTVPIPRDVVYARKYARLYAKFPPFAVGLSCFATAALMGWLRVEYFPLIAPPVFVWSRDALSFFADRWPRWRSWLRAHLSGPHDDPEIVEARRTACANCQLRETVGTKNYCRACNCGHNFTAELRWKTALLRVNCPRGYWGYDGNADQKLVQLIVQRGA